MVVIINVPFPMVPPIVGEKISMAKYPTNIENPSESIMGCIEALAKERNLTDQQLLGDTATLVIGTTLPTNMSPG